MDINQLLKKLIGCQLRPQNRLDYRRVMTKLTNFVDGLYFKNENIVEYQNLEDLTYLQVMNFDDINQALSFAFAVGVNNSVVLVQQYKVVAGVISLDELDTSSSSSNEDINQIFGYVVVFVDNPDLSVDDIEDKFNNADIQAVITQQSKRYTLLTQFQEETDMDFIMRMNEAASAISGGYITKEKWAEYKSLLPDCSFRGDILWINMEVDTQKNKIQ